MSGGEGMWMDTTQLRGHASQINGGVASVRHLIDEITDMLEGIYWEGADKRHFFDDWNGLLRPQASQVLQAMQDSAAELARRADAQDELSRRG